MTIKAFLLAAGFGTRLRPITNSIPKCLVPLGEKTLLGIWLEKLEQVNCKSVLVNTHYLASQVIEFIDDYKNKTESKMNIEISHEENILGTGGSLLSNLNFLDSSLCIVIHADNFMYESLGSALKQHQEMKPLLTMVTFTSNNPQTCGIVKIDSDGMVQSFHEKVSNPPGNMANGAIYIFDQCFVKYLKESNLDNANINDISNDIIPSLVGRIQVWHTEEMFADIGSIEYYNKAQKFFISHGIE